MTIYLFYLSPPVGGTLFVPPICCICPPPGKAMLSAGKQAKGQPKPPCPAAERRRQLSGISAWMRTREAG